MTPEEIRMTEQLGGREYRGDQFHPLDSGTVHAAHRMDHAVMLAKSANLLEKTIESAERNGAGENLSQAIDRKKIGELWASWRSTTDESERETIMRKILELSASMKPNALAAAKRELKRIDREIDETIEGHDTPKRGSLAENADRRRREFEASRQGVVFQG